jgi:hypothetical protein
LKETNKDNQTNTIIITDPVRPTSIRPLTTLITVLPGYERRNDINTTKHKLDWRFDGSATTYISLARYWVYKFDNYIENANASEAAYENAQR